MTTKKRLHYVRRALAITAALLIAVCAWAPAIQDMANSQVDAGLKRSLITYASARALNAVISVVQGTELSVQPLGVGVTLTLGQILDPINDLVEQFSSLMLVASVAFGIQKVLLVVGAHWMISTLVTGFAVAWAALKWWDNSPPWMTRVMLVLLMIRFAIPLVTIGSDLVFQHVMAKDYGESQRVLDMSAQEVKVMTPKKPNAEKAPQGPILKVPAGESGAASAPKPSWRDRLPSIFGNSSAGEEVDAEKESIMERAKGVLAGKLPSVMPDFEGIKKSLEAITERIIKLIVIFLAQTIIIPLVLTWVFYVVVLGVIRPSQAPPLRG